MFKPCVSILCIFFFLSFFQGFGDTTPETTLGKTVTIVYALVGIPLMLLYLSNVGEVLARGVKRVYNFLCCCSSNPKVPPGTGVLRQQQQHASPSIGSSSLLVKADGTMPGGPGPDGAAGCGPLYLSNHVSSASIAAGAGAMVMTPGGETQHGSNAGNHTPVSGMMGNNQQTMQRGIFATENAR